MAFTSARRWLPLVEPLRTEKRALTALGVALAGSTALPLAAPLLLRRFVDDASAGAPTSTLVEIALVYLAIAAIGQAFTVGTSFLGSRLAWTATNRVRERAAEHTLGLDLSFHANHTAGEMI